MLGTMNCSRPYCDAPLSSPRRLALIRRWALAIGLLAGICAPIQRAAAVTFDQALTAAAQGPLIAGLEKAGRVRAHLDAQLPKQTGNPEFAVGLGPGAPPGGSVGPAIQLSGGQSWNLADLAPARRQAAAAERLALGAELRLELLRARLAAAQAWLALRAAQQAHQLAEQEAVLAAELADAVTRAAARGAALHADAVEAQGWVAEAKLMALGHEGQMRVAAADLARRAVLPSWPAPVADGAWPAPVLPDAASWRSQTRDVAQAPAAVQRRLLAQVEQLRGVEAQAAQGSAFSLGGQFQRDADGTWAVFATAGLRWSAFERGQRAQAQAAAEGEKLKGEAEQAERDAAVEFDIVEHEVEHARETVVLLERTLLPALHALVEARQQAFRRGTGPVFDLLRARRALLEAQRRHALVRGDQAWAEVKAWILLATLRQEARP